MDGRGGPAAPNLRCARWAPRACAPRRAGTSHLPRKPAALKKERNKHAASIFTVAATDKTRRLPFSSAHMRHTSQPRSRHRAPRALISVSLDGRDSLRPGGPRAGMNVDARIRRPPLGSRKIRVTRGSDPAIARKSPLLPPSLLLLKCVKCHARCFARAATSNRCARVTCCGGVCLHASACLLASRRAPMGLYSGHPAGPGHCSVTEPSRCPSSAAVAAC